MDYKDDKSDMALPWNHRLISDKIFYQLKIQMAGNNQKEPLWLLWKDIN